MAPLPQRPGVGPLQGWERRAVTSLSTPAVLQAAGGPAVPEGCFRPAGHVGEGQLCLTPREPGPGGPGGSRSSPQGRVAVGGGGQARPAMLWAFWGAGRPRRGAPSGRTPTGRQPELTGAVRLCPQAQGPHLVHPEGGRDPKMFQPPWCRQCSEGRAAAWPLTGRAAGTKATRSPQARGPRPSPPPPGSQDPWAGPAGGRPCKGGGGLWLRPGLSQRPDDARGGEGAGGCEQAVP